MSITDGEVHDDSLYVTSDIAFAAYLLVRGYELLGAIDTGTKRKEFAITSTNEDILRDLHMAVLEQAHAYDRSAEKMFYKMTKELHHALDTAIKKER